MAKQRGWVVGRLFGRLFVVTTVLGIVAIGGPAWYVNLISGDRITSLEAAPVLPVALVLGAEVYPGGQPSRYLSARLDVAYELFQAGKVKVILVSGDNSAEHQHESDAMRNYLIGRGVPAARVVGDPSGFDTYDSCVRARKIFGVSRVVVVSQTYHLPRALATCRAIGLDAWGVGDQTAKSNEQMWWYGTVRELAANLKMVWDVISQRQPVLGPRETGVDEALKGS